MILDKKTIETTITYILQREQGTLYDKKDIFFFLRKAIREKEEICGKIKYLGYGSHGIVIKPPLKINILNDVKIHPEYNSKYVSKILYNKDECMNDIYNEYLIGQKLQKIDPNNDYFIYPIDLERQSPSFSNIIMKKGYSLDDNFKKFTESDIYKIFFNLLNGIQKLLDNNIVNLDIKSDNILLNRIDKDLYKCVFIDFTSELVLETKEDFLEYCNHFKNFIHPYWPYEINCILNFYYNKKNKDVENNPIYFNGKQDELFHEYQLDKTIDDLYYRAKIHKIIIEDLNNNLIKFFEKIMIFQFGKMFEYLIHNKLKHYNTQTYYNFSKFINYLINDDYTKRYDIKKIKEKFNFSDKKYIINLKK